MRERNIGQRKLSSHALFGGLRRNAGEHIAAAQRRGFRQQFAQAAEAVALVSDRGREAHTDAIRIAAKPPSEAAAGLCVQFQNFHSEFHLTPS